MKGRPSAEKRRKEVRRLERQLDKANRRKLRKEEKALGGRPDELADGELAQADGERAQADGEVDAKQVGTKQVDAEQVDAEQVGTKQEASRSSSLNNTPSSPTTSEPSVSKGEREPLAKRARPAEKARPVASLSGAAPASVGTRGLGLEGRKGVE